MKLEMLTFPGLTPFKVVPASMKRTWMEENDGMAYRCLPMTIANASCWEILCPADITVSWNGDPRPHSMHIRMHAKTEAEKKALKARDFIIANHFGMGVLTFVVNCIFRTEPGWDLYVTGPVNHVQDHRTIAVPLTGIVETDWSPASFTLNYKFRTPDVDTYFIKDEPIAAIFPVKRGALEHFQVTKRPITADPEFERRYVDWQDSRKAFNSLIHMGDPGALKQKWQKDYHQGNVAGVKAPPDHRTKVRLKGFDT